MHMHCGAIGLKHFFGMLILQSSPALVVVYNIHLHPTFNFVRAKCMKVNAVKFFSLVEDIQLDHQR